MYILEMPIKILKGAIFFIFDYQGFNKIHIFISLKKYVEKTFCQFVKNQFTIKIIHLSWHCYNLAYDYELNIQLFILLIQLVN